MAKTARLDSSPVLKTCFRGFFLLHPPVPGPQVVEQVSLTRHPGPRGSWGSASLAENDALSSKWHLGELDTKVMSADGTGSSIFADVTSEG